MPAVSAGKTVLARQCWQDSAATGSLSRLAEAGHVGISESAPGLERHAVWTPPRRSARACRLRGPGRSAGRGSPAQAAAAYRQAVPARPSGVVAAAGELVDATSGRWLWSRGLDTKHPIASITKVMTALVVLSAGQLNRKITVTQAAVTYAQENDAGSAGLHAGDVLTAWQLLEALLLPSGADAAYLLAHSYGPGPRAFVRKMNAAAARLGMTQTHFANFDGLPWPTEYSTYSSPRDLIIMGEAAMKNADFRKIVGQRRHYIGATGSTTSTTGRTPICCCPVTGARSASRRASPGAPGTACYSRRGATAGT